MKEITERRSIRKYKSDEIEKDDIETIIRAGILAPSAKNRQPWRYIVYTKAAKDNLLEVMEKGLLRERDGDKLLPKSSNGLPDAFHTLKIIGASVQNMLLTATELGYGTLWIANTCFAYNELIDFTGIKGQLVGAVSIGVAKEQPNARPRKDLSEVVEFRSI